MPFLSKLVRRQWSRSASRWRTWKVPILREAGPCVSCLYPTYFPLRQPERNVTSPPRRQAGPTPPAAARTPTLVQIILWPPETPRPSSRNLQVSMAKLEPTRAAVTRNSGKLSPASSAARGRVRRARGARRGKAGSPPRPQRRAPAARRRHPAPE